MFHQYNQARHVLVASRVAATLLVLSPIAASQSLTRAWWTSGHAGPVTTAVAASDGSSYLTTSHDGTARIWQPSAPTQTVLPGPTGPVNAGDLRADGSLAVYGDQAGSLFLYDPATGNLVTKPDVPEGPVRELRFSSDGTLVTSVGDGGAVVRAAATGDVVRTLVADDTTSTVDAGAGTLAVTGRGTSVELWDIASGALLLTLDAGAEVTDVAISDPGTIVAAQAGASGVSVWSTSNAQLLVNLPDTNLNIRCIELTTDGAVLLVGDLAGNVHLFLSSTGLFLGAITSHVDELMDVRMVGTLPFFLTAGRDGSSWAWEAATLQVLGPVSQITGMMWGAAASYSGATVTSGALRRITIQSAADGSHSRTIIPQDQSSVTWAPYGTQPLDRAVLTSLDVNIQGTRIVGGGMDGHMKFFDVATGNRTFSTQLTNSMVTAVRASFDDSKVFAATLEGAISAWSTSTNTNLWTITPPTLGSVHRLCCSPDGSKVAATGSKGRVEVFDATSGQSLGAITDLPFEPNDVALSNDGTSLVICDGGGSVDVWQLGAPSPILSHDFVDGEAIAAAQIVGQDRFLAVSSDGDVVLVDIPQLTVTSVSVDEKPSDVTGIGWSAGTWVIFDRQGVFGYSATGL